MSVLFVMGLTVVLTGIGWGVVGRLDRDGLLFHGERLAVSFCIGCLAVYAGVFAIGPWRLDATAMWGLTALLALAAAPGLRRMPWGGYAAGLRDQMVSMRDDPWLSILWASAILISLSSLLQGMAPPNDYDSLMYHLALPKFDIETGRLAIPWDRGLVHALFPALGGHLSRLALAAMGPGAAQMMHGVLGLVAALGAAMLVKRLGLGVRVSLGAVIFFLATRVVIWQMASVEVDVPLAAFTILALNVYLASRDSGQMGLAVLFGLMIGGGILVKYHGFAVAIGFAPLIIHDLLRRRLSLSELFIGPAVAFALIIPHLIKDYLITGNPLFPLFNHVINPGDPVFFQTMAAAFGTGRGIIDLITAPWNIFVSPMHNFDGMIFGAPFLLALAPLILLNPRQARNWAPAAGVAAVYFVEWFYLLSQQVRFLAPIMPVMAAAGAAGTAAMWEKVRRHRILKPAFLTLSLILAGNQGLFVAVYTAIRLPAALGVMSPGDFHANTPTMNGAFYKTCRFIQQRLKPGRTYFSLLQPHSYYCPQVSVVHKYFEDESRWWLKNDEPPEMSLGEFTARAEKADFQFFVLQLTLYDRRNDTAHMNIRKFDLSNVRFGSYLQPVLNQLEPLVEGPYTAVYDGPQVIAGLRASLQ